MMGGNIGAISSPEEGSEFWIELIQVDPPQVTALQDARLSALPAPEMVEGALHTLLYVEDNAANMELVAQLIARRPNLKLLRADDALHGLALARAELPDLILMDINLPGMSGMDAMQLLRENPVTRHIPVMALSANAMPRDIEKAMDVGFFCYLTKPIKLTEFMDALDAGLILAQQVSAPEDLSEIAQQTL
jgi:CheY-like chemotaxis protein